jgi:hypothetical protein
METTGAIALEPKRTCELDKATSLIGALMRQLLDGTEIVGLPGT